MENSGAKILKASLREDGSRAGFRIVVFYVDGG
jgi:hypothetical protein